jgi:inorganic triphosphatase YgiF
MEFHPYRATAGRYVFRAMASEIEIKLKASASALKAVRKLDWLMAMAQGKAQRKSLRSVYFDTGKLKLQEDGLTLRVRHVGKKRLQTAKTDNKDVFARYEWEGEIGGDIPDLTALPLEARQRFGKLTALRPIFETVVTRTTIPLLCNGTKMELALDSGVVKAGQQRLPICEIEIELKEGDPAGLVVVAKRLASEVAVSLEVQAKSERGYALAGGEWGYAVQARLVQLDATMTLAEAFRVIAMEGLWQLACNEAAVLGGDVEGVHQMRLGLRRLCAAMSLFKEMLSDSQSQTIQTEIKWLSEQLAYTRDEDVLARARKVVESERYSRLVLAVALWLANGVWGRDEDLMQRARRDRPVLSFANEVLEARTSKVNKKARKLRTLAPRARHKLRRMIKKLRYAGEAFAILYEGNKAKARQQKMCAKLKALQTALSRLNALNAGKSQKESHGIVIDRELGERTRLLATACKARDQLKAQKPFWS